MNLREISAIGGTIQSLAGRHAVLYLWATTPHLPGALSVMDAWGFRYRSLHVWKKARIACGFWARSNAELILIGERGRPCAPDGAMLAATILEGPAKDRAHSSKPDAIHALAEKLWPEAPKVELFARRHREGWQCYGSDLGQLISADGIMDVYA